MLPGPRRLHRVRIGFACLWDRRAVATWSHIPWYPGGATRHDAEVTEAFGTAGRSASDPILYRPLFGGAAR